MRTVYIVEAVRTPLGKRGGGLANRRRLESGLRRGFVDSCILHVGGGEGD